MIPEDPTRPYWRVGRTVGRTLYIHDGDDPNGPGRLVGLMDTVGLAEYVVAAVQWYQHTYGISTDEWVRARDAHQKHVRLAGLISDVKAKHGDVPLERIAPETAKAMRGKFSLWDEVDHYWRSWRERRR